MPIKLFITDVDGTMTDGRFTVDALGNETKTFNVKDGMAIKLLKNAGIKTAIISGRPSTIVENRANSLGIDYCFFSNDKAEIIRDLCERNGLSLLEVAYIGDDLNDLEVFREVPCCGCPKDACSDIRRLASYICKAKGGHGAVREFAEFVLHS